MNNVPRIPLDENLVLGLDVGIASVGWCLLRERKDADEALVFELLASPPSGGQIVPSLGVRCMDVPENAKTKELLNVKRRAADRMRLTTQRRARRMAAVRRLVAQTFCPAAQSVKEFHQPLDGRPQCDPWQLRAESVERLLSPEDFAQVLLHMAKHRGFLSNSKKDSSDKDSGAVLSAASALSQKMAEAQAETFAALMAGESKKRNRAGWDGKPDYSHTPLRIFIREEAQTIFAAQRRFGNPAATPELEAEYLKLAFTQRPLQSVANLIGNCAFLEKEKRAPRFAPTAEKFRLAQRLTTLRIKEAGNVRGLDASDINFVLQMLGEQKGVTYKAVRKQLSLSPSAEFEGLGAKNDKGKDPEAADVASRTGGCGAGSRALCGRLGREAYVRLRDLDTEKGFCLDLIAKTISENDDKKAIFDFLETLPLKKEERDALVAGIEAGDFSAFRGTMRLSLKAMRIILPEMIAMGDYSKGCEAAGFDHTNTRRADWADVRNPVVLRILREVSRQVHAVIREFGVLPGRVHVEMLREVGKSIDERNQIEKGIKDRTSEKKKAKERLAELFGDSPENISADELRRYELWKQQGGKCAYYMLASKAGMADMYAREFKEGGISPAMLRDSARLTEIDHILPYSRTSDNSFHNQALCLTAANQRKGNRTPYEWLGKDNPNAWHAHCEWVKSLSVSGFKKRNLSMENLDAEKEKRFHRRNLHDSSYAARLVLGLVEDILRMYGADFTKEDGGGKRRVLARPGGVTSTLRHRWGVNGLKYISEEKAQKDGTTVEEKKRAGDRHHALDAMVVAACGEGLLQRVTDAFKAEKEKEAVFPAPKIVLPEAVAPSANPGGKLNFRDGAKAALQQVLVSRAERAKTTGPLHEETLRSIRVETDAKGREVKMLYERWSINDLEEKDLENIKDADRNKELIEELRAWIRAGKPKDSLPRTGKSRAGKAAKGEGDVIRRVRVRRGAFTSGVTLKRGDGEAQADNASWVRADVYTKGGKYFIVPVFTMDVARKILPDRAVAVGKPESEWPVMDESYDFLFSLSPNSYVVTERNGNIKEGYYVGADKSTASIILSNANDKEEKIRGIGVATLHVFEKYRADRMGRLHRVRSEPRPQPPIKDKKQLFGKDST